jgi:hypothetical protein
MRAVVNHVIQELKHVHVRKDLSGPSDHIGE